VELTGFSGAIVRPLIPVEIVYLPVLTATVSEEVDTARVYVPAGGLVTPLATTVTGVESPIAVGVVMVAVSVPPPLTVEARMPFTE
jgi:hypothetical protein